MKMDDKDKELIGELLLGSEKGLEKFYSLYERRLWYFINSRVGCAEDGEEIFQDTMLSFLDFLALFSGRSSLFSWLCGIARHEISDYYRKQKIKTVVFSRFPGFSRFISKALEPDAKMMRLEYERRVRKALEKLLPHYREALELKYMDGMSVSEIARRLNLSFKGCESVLWRARQAFEVAYEEA